MDIIRQRKKTKKLNELKEERKRIVEDILTGNEMEELERETKKWIKSVQFDREKKEKNKWRKCGDDFGKNVLNGSK